jgi:hypothetical protein
MGWQVKVPQSTHCQAHRGRTGRGGGFGGGEVVGYLEEVGG